VSLRSLLHYVSLDGAGGVELQFVEFVHAARQLTGIQQAVVACGDQINPLVADRLASTGVPATFEKYTGPIKLPKWPRAIRARHQRRLVRRVRPDAVVIWNRLRASLDTLAAAGPQRCVYWERGASWFAGETPAKRQFLANVPAALCNSFAARRMLELRWGYQGRVQVVPNALRPSLLPDRPMARRAPTGECLRLGLVARLQPIKGVAVALQALATLRARGVEASLAIAGDGPGRERLVNLAEHLGISDRVCFEGLVADMGAFYQRIDVLVHPALREPFGQIAVEAGVYGVPAVVAAVDGLVEVIRHEQTGLCVLPTLALSTYAELGGGTSDLPPFVYDPASDQLQEPKVVDPAHLADALTRLIHDVDLYERLSKQAVAAAIQDFDFTEHVRDALAAIDGFVG
jgi:glycosyltransferase involved in cell wall biosynthesis